MLCRIATLIMVVALTLATTAILASAQAPKSEAPASGGNSKEKNGKTEKSEVNKNQVTSPMDKIRRLRMIVGANRPPLPLGAAAAPGNGPRFDRDFLAAMSLLTISNALQDELKMAGKQRTQVTKISDRVDAFKDQELRSTGRADPGQTAEERQAVSAEVRERAHNFAEQAEVAYRAVLNPAQVTRLEQIILQIKGPLAVAKPEIAELIMLEPDQLQQVHQIWARMRSGQQNLGTNPVGIPSSDPEARAQGGAKTQDSAAAKTKGRNTAPPAAKKPVVVDDDEEASPTAKAAAGVPKGAEGGATQGEPRSPANIAANQARRETIADENETLREKAIQEVSKVLTPSQKTAFNRLLGKRIPDLSSLLSEKAMALGSAPAYTWELPARRTARPSAGVNAGVLPAASAKKK
jgi:hypothetical protein